MAEERKDSVAETVDTAASAAHTVKGASLGQVAYPHYTANGHHYGIRQRRLYRPGYLCGKNRRLE